MSNENEAGANPKTTGQSRMYQVVADYQGLYPDPLSVMAGEPLEVSERVEYWNENPDWIWIWCTDQRGKSGWTPKDAIDFHTSSTTGIARYDYAATELTVAVGDELVVEREESGWLWCTNRQGKSGWVPADHITEI
jgi:uncharacterized protein YgiM (DUF1202 family)